MRRILFGWLWFVTTSLCATDVILVGSGGTESYQQVFQEWATRLKTVLVQDFQRSPASVHVLFSDPALQTEEAKALTKAGLDSFFTELAASHAAKDPLFVYFIGHGSHLRQEAKFQIAGPDLSAQELAAFMGRVDASAQVLINGTSASAGFINVLSGANRIVCTATKSSRETNATEFMGHFVTALAEGLADLDGDGNISVYEACWRAASLTQSSYTLQGLVATEHAILDDNGDGLGSRLFEDPDQQINEPVGKDGALARRVYLKAYQYPESVPKELVRRYEKQLEKIINLKQQKASLANTTYLNQLENLLLEAARINREIHQLMPAVLKEDSP